MKPLIILVSGLPRAGKSAFADAVEESSLGLTHVPMDKYIMPIPAGKTFLQWVKEPSCVDWQLLVSHLKVLYSGRVCFTPKPNWEQAGIRISEGGPIEHGAGRRMLPSEHGYIIAGTHVYSLPELNLKRISVFVDTSDVIIASRLEGYPVQSEKAADVIFEHMNDNPIPIRLLRRFADLVIDGSQPHELQVGILKAFIETMNTKEPNMSMKETG